MVNIPITMEANRAEILVGRVISDTIDIAIRNSAHWGTEMINDAWIRLNKFQISDLIKDIDEYLNGNTIIRKIYEMPPKFGYKSFMSIEVGKYTNHELEIIISNGSRLISGIVNETFVRIPTNEAKTICNALIEALAQ